MDKPPTRYLIVLGALLLAAGWVVLFLGWQRAGEQELETGQIPFIISGGFGGWALIVMGVGAILADVIQRAGWHSARKAEEIRRELEGLSERLSEAISPAGGEEPERPRRSRTRSSTRTRGGRSKSA